MLQQHYSLFDSFFAPTRVVVVSEERLKQAEIKSLKPAKAGADLDALDGGTTDG